MSSIWADNIQTCGRTPLVRLQSIGRQDTPVLAKIEGRNPCYSVKDRVGIALVEDAEAKGLLRPGSEIVEPTSGNTGIALAFVGAIKGYAVTLTMPESMSIERRRVLAMLGANIVLTPAAEGMPGAIRRAQQLVSEAPDKRYMPQQFENPANPAAHERTTGPEIWKDTDGAIDVLVSAVGSGGTITGIARYIKQTKGKNITVVAVEPELSAVITQALAGQELVTGKHGIQGIGAGFIPKILDLSLIDRVERVSDADALRYARVLAREDGILAGISSGAATAASARIATMPEFAGKTIVTILPDLGERYVSSPLFAGMGE